MYVWELSVRVTHWLIFLAIAVLAVTGFYIGDPFITVSGPAREHFVMGTMRVIHLYAAIVFTLSVLVRVYWMFAGNYYARWDRFIPVSRERLRSTLQAVEFYSLCAATRRMIRVIAGLPRWLIRPSSGSTL